MKIGDYEVYSIETGTFGLDGGAMFSIVPKTIWNKKNPADEKNRIDLSLRSLLIIGNKRCILVDTGIGEKFSEKYREIYKIDHTKHDIYTSLKKHGLVVEDITDVIITHLHFDHAGGSTSLINGALRPTFPKSNYYIQKKHLHLAHKPSVKDAGSFRQEDFMPLEESGKLEVIDGEGEIFPNISLLISNGHTSGLQHVKVSDSNNTLIYCADLIPTTSHIQLPYVMSYDLYPLTTIEEKKTFLDNAVENDWILFFEHDPLTEAVKIKRTEKGFEIKEKIVL